MPDGAADFLRGADRRLTAARADIAAASLEGQVNSARFVEATPMQVSASSIALRPAPDLAAGIDTELLFGEPFDVFEALDGWLWGQAPRDGYVGYAPDFAFSARGAAATHMLTVPISHVYESESIKFEPITTLYLTALVAVDSVTEKFATTKDGFIPITHLTALDALGGDFVTVAETFLHAPYVWGGKTPAGLDCSALTQLSMAAVGRSVLRDSDMQAGRIGTEIIPNGPLQRGDLLFWKGHTGIMVDPDTLLHSTEYTMRTRKEPVAEARARIEGKLGIPLAGIRRP